MANESLISQSTNENNDPPDVTDIVIVAKPPAGGTASRIVSEQPTNVNLVQAAIRVSLSFGRPVNDILASTYYLQLRFITLSTDAMQVVVPALDYNALFDSVSPDNKKEAIYATAPVPFAGGLDDTGRFLMAFQLFDRKGILLSTGQQEVTVAAV